MTIDGAALAEPLFPTVSRAFVQDWIDVLRTHCDSHQLARFLAEVDIQLEEVHRSRVTHDQIVRLYQLVAVETGDEMMGLWSRPVRTGALKHICASVRTASSLGAALHRFVTFWNLVLDDHRLALDNDDTHGLRVSLVSNPGVEPNRFGHMLLLKLTHGIASWVAGHELPVVAAGFAFAPPEFADDYTVLFPTRVGFDCDRSFITFERQVGLLPVERSAAEMNAFLVRAPRDWIFTSRHEHALALHVRELLLISGSDLPLVEVARRVNRSPRALMRHLAAEGTSLQGIRDGLRRDIALRELAHSTRSIASIAHQLGYTSDANFHRAFKRWTGSTPGSYRGG